MNTEKPDQAILGPDSRKRSLFNKPSWSRPQTLNNDTDLFHRSNQTYADLAAEAEHARKRKLASKARERASRYSLKEPAGKGRRASVEEDDDEHSCSDESSRHSSPKGMKQRTTGSVHSSAALSTVPQSPVHSPKSLLRRYEAKLVANKAGQYDKQKHDCSSIIDLEGMQVPSTIAGQRQTWECAAVKPASSPDEDDRPASDEEFPELARRARDNARKKRHEEDIVSTAAVSADSQLFLRHPINPVSQPDPVLQILITSEIENTIPLIVSRRLSQRLKDVRLTWAKRQNFTTTFTDEVFLTWRGKRVFDVTTCRSLGIITDPIGKFRMTEGSWEEEEGQIHMEAMTTKLLEAHRRSKHKENSIEKIDARQEKAEEVLDDGVQVRIILKARGLDDFKLQVRPVRHPCVGCYFFS